jgi:hypothetical protein
MTRIETNNQGVIGKEKVGARKLVLKNYLEEEQK